MSEESQQTTAPPRRYDVLLVSQNRAFNVVEQGLKSLVNFLQATNVVRIADEAIAKEWTELYCNPGPTPHDLFMRGPYQGTDAPFLELAIRSGTRPCLVPYGPEQAETCYFWIEVRGSLFPEIAGKFKTKLKDLLATRFDFYQRDHVPAPPHATVPPDEVPDEKPRARKDGATPRVGTAVEEF
jgi:hypothetical protein